MMGDIMTNDYFLYVPAPVTEEAAWEWNAEFGAVSGHELIPLV
jgi:hypothetical protein